MDTTVSVLLPLFYYRPFLRLERTLDESQATVAYIPDRIVMLQQRATDDRETILCINESLAKAGVRREGSDAQLFAGNGEVEGLAAGGLECEVDHCGEGGYLGAWDPECAWFGSVGLYVGRDECVDGLSDVGGEDKITCA